MRDIEDPDGASDSIVLGDHAGVLDGHVPSAEIRGLRAGSLMPVEQWGASQRLVRHPATVAPRPVEGHPPVASLGS